MLALMAEFAALAGSRRAEFLDLQIPQIDMQAGVIRLMRAKRARGQQEERTSSSGPAMECSARRLLALPRPDTSMHVFLNQQGNPLSGIRVTTGWQRAMVACTARRCNPTQIHLPRPAGCTTPRSSKSSTAICQNCMQTRQRQPVSTIDPRSPESIFEMMHIPTVGIKPERRYN